MFANNNKDALVVDQGLISEWKLLDKVMRISHRGSSLYVVCARIIEAIRDIPCDGVAEEVRILGDDAYLSPEPGCIDLSQIYSFNGHLRMHSYSEECLDYREYATGHIKSSTLLQP